MMETKKKTCVCLRFLREYQIETWKLQITQTNDATRTQTRRYTFVPPANRQERISSCSLSGSSGTGKTIRYFLLFFVHFRGDTLVGAPIFLNSRNTRIHHQTRRLKDNSIESTSNRQTKRRISILPSQSLLSFVLVTFVPL